MNDKYRKTTIIFGFANIISILTGIILGYISLKRTGAFEYNNQSEFVSLYLSLFIMPAVWLAVCIYLQVSKLKNRTSVRIFMIVILIAHLIDTVIMIVRSVDYISDYVIPIILRMAFLISLLIWLLVEKSRKVINLIYMTEAGAFGIYNIYGIVKSLIQFSSAQHMETIELVEIGLLLIIQPLVLYGAMIFFMRWIILNENKGNGIKKGIE